MSDEEQQKKDRVLAFFKDLREVFDKHGLELDSCGDCQSIWVREQAKEGQDIGTGEILVSEFSVDHQPDREPSQYYLYEQAHGFGFRWDK